MIYCRRSSISFQSFKSVGNLSWGTNDDSLYNIFSSFGQVTDAIVLRDRETGRSRGFGFVTFSSTDEADSAVKEMDGKDVDGRQIRVNIATERPPREGGNNRY